MKLSDFEKQLSHSCAHAYLILASCAFERRKICERICEVISQKCKKELAIKRFDGKEIDETKAIEELNTFGLLMGQPVVIIDEVDKLKKPFLEFLSSYVKKDSTVYLLLGGASSKGLGNLAKQEGVVVCDLSSEKPWERKERLKKYLIEKASREGKTLMRDALDALVERVGPDLALLEQEMDKLLCYSLDRAQVTKRDVEAICPPPKHLSVWQLADAILWQEKMPSIDSTFELSSFLILLGYMRSQLQQGMKLTVQLQQGGRGQSFSPPLQKMLPLVQRRSRDFFQKALALLFDLEMLAKGSSLSAPHLLHLLMSKIHVIPSA